MRTAPSWKGLLHLFSYFVKTRVSTLSSVVQNRHFDLLVSLCPFFEVPKGDHLLFPIFLWGQGKPFSGKSSEGLSPDQFPPGTGNSWNQWYHFGVGEFTK